MEKVIYESDLEEREKCEEDAKDITIGVAIGGWDQTVAGHRWHAIKKCFIHKQWKLMLLFGEKNNMITVQTYLLNKEQAWALGDNL